MNAKLVNVDGEDSARRPWRMPTPQARGLLHDSPVERYLRDVRQIFPRRAGNSDSVLRPAGAWGRKGQWSSGWRTGSGWAPADPRAVSHNRNPAR